MNKTEYLLVCIAEEASEVAKAASKCLRFSPEDNYVDGKNIDLLRQEFIDLYTVLQMYSDITGYRFDAVFDEKKADRVANFMNRSRRLGALL